jgi:uncharacterized membrane protein YgcG
MKNKFLNFKSLILIITLAFAINFFNISANADSNIPDPSELLCVTNNAKDDINTSKKSSGDSLIPQRSQLIWVTDNADVLTDSDIKYVITKNENFPKTSNAEISVLTIESLPESYDIETYAYKVFDEWGMNSKEKKAVLLLIVSGENKTFIATDSGLKNALKILPAYSSIKENFATSLSTYDNKYNISNVVSKLATTISTIDKKIDIYTAKRSSGDSLIPQRSELIWVTDDAGVLDDSDIKSVIAENEKFAETSNAEISVLTIRNLPEGYDIETYAYKVLDEWGMNSKEKNNGVLLLIVSREKKGFIATGSGLKNPLTNSPEYSSIEKSFSTFNSRYGFTSLVSKLATKINTIYINTSKKSSSDSLIPQRSQFIWVTDNADVLSDDDIKSVIAENEKFAKTSNAEISVLTIESLPEGYDIETYAYKVFDEWGMNSKEKNNGVLLLIVSDENKTFIATGSGLKSALTDSIGYELTEKCFAEAINTYNYTRITFAVSRLATEINTIDKNNSYNSGDSDNSDTPYLIYLIIFLIIIFIFCYLLKRASKSSSCENSRKENAVKITSSAKEPTSSTVKITSSAKELTSSTDETISSAKEPTSSTDEIISSAKEPTSSTDEIISSAKEPTSSIDETISSGDKAVDVIISEGLAYLRQIKQANHAITDEKITVHITRMEVATDKIFRYIAKHPEDAPQIRKFMNYYLPTLLKLLNSYISLNEQGIKGGHISSTIENIEGILSTIADAFEKLLDNLFADAALDISTDIKVLKNMLAQEGLTSDGFKN